MATDSPSNPSPPAPPPAEKVATRAPLLGVTKSRLPKFQTPSQTATPPGLAGVGSDPFGSLGQSASTATPSSADGPAKVKIEKAVFKEVCRGAVVTITELVHDNLARTEAAKAAGIWLADEKDEKGIGDPLARIAERHADPIAGTPDLADLIAAAIAGIVYGSKNIRKLLKVRRELRRATVEQPLPEAEPTPLAGQSVQA
jgi:hypothetical protein